MRDDRFERHEAPAGVDEAVEALRHLDASEPLLAESGSTARTPSEFERPEMYGNGCPAPTASGREDRIDLACEPRLEPPQLLRRAVLDRARSRCPRRRAPGGTRAVQLPPAGRSGPRRAPDRRERDRGREAVGRPHGEAGATWPIRPATRTMKNSSRFDEKIEQNLTRSSSGASRRRRDRARAR